MTNTFMKQDYRNCTIHLFYDENAESPRNWSNLGRFFTFSNRYSTPDEYILPRGGFEENIRAVCSDLYPDQDHGFEDEKTYSIPKCISLIREKAFFNFVYRYAHGSIKYSLAPFLCPWDSGVASFIYASHADILQAYGVSEMTDHILEMAQKSLEGEIEVYNTWVNGDVCGFEVTGPDSKRIDICHGFYSQEDALTEAKAAIEHYHKNKCREKHSMIKIFI